MSKNKYAFTAIVLIIWIASFFLITDWAGIDFAGTLFKINPLAFILGYLFYALAVLACISILYRCLKAMNIKPSLRAVSKAWIFGSFIDNIVPTITPLGEASMAYFLEKFYRISYVNSLAAIGMYVSSWGLATSFFSIISLLLIQAFVGLQNMISGTAIVLIVIAVAIFVLLTTGWFLLITNRRIVERIVCKLVKFYNRVYNLVKSGKVSYEYCVYKVEFDKTYESLELFMKNKKQMTLFTLLFGVPLVAHALCLYFILLGFGVNISFFSVLLVHIISSVAGLITFIPAGMGVYEVVSSSTLGLTASSEVAVAAIFLYRLIFVWTTNIIGGLVGVLQGIEHPTRMKHEAG